MLLKKKKLDQAAIKIFAKKNNELRLILWISQKFTNSKCSHTFHKERKQ